MKIRVGVFFGGQSVEHEVSVISGIQAYLAFDKEKYEVFPVYITKKNEFYMGEEIGSIAAYKDIPALLKKSTRMIMVKEGEQVLLREQEVKAFHKPFIQEIDVAVPVVHGTNVEDGTLEGFFRTLTLPYTGCDVTSSALGMDKFACKCVLLESGIPVLPGLMTDHAAYRRNAEGELDRIEKKLGYPVIIKPVNLGSSVGISIAHDRNQLKSSLEDAFGYALRVLVEHAITNLKEVNVSVLGDYESAEASECESPLGSDEILSYKDKYMSGGGTKGAKTAPEAAENGGAKSASSGMASLSRELPAKITPEQKEQIKNISLATFKALNCSGVARIDCMIDQDDGKIYVNEINTIPGSLSFYLWDPVGVTYDVLLSRMVELALKRERELSELSFSFDTNLLATANLGGAKK